MTVPFISSLDMRVYLRIPEGSEDGDLIAIAADSACEIVRDYCEQDFQSGEVVLIVSGHGTDRIYLPVQQVTSISEIKVYTGTVGDPTETPEILLDADDTYTFHGGTIKRYSGVFPFGWQNIQVTLVAGYIDVPSPVRMVALQVASRIYQFGMNESLSTGSYSAQFVKGAASLTAMEKDVLRRYKVV